MSAHDVEISIRVSPGDWTEESLESLIQGYQQKIAEMGANPSEIKTFVDRTKAGGVNVRVEWVREPQNY